MRRGLSRFASIAMAFAVFVARSALKPTQNPQTRAGGSYIRRTASCLPFAPDRRQQPAEHAAHHNLDINTIMKILVSAGEKCNQLMGRVIVNVPVKDVECDEFGASSARRKVTNRRRKQATKAWAMLLFCRHREEHQTCSQLRAGRRNQATTDVFH